MFKSINIQGWSHDGGEFDLNPVILSAVEEFSKSAATISMTQEMQDFWNDYPKKLPEKFLYVRINILGAGEYWGSNLNGDYFTEKMLKDYHKTFMSARMYLHHDNDDPAKSIGKVIFASYNDAPDAKRVEVLVAIDRNNPRAAATIKKIESGDGINVSMGCFLAGSLVTMSDGTRKSIETIEIGDEVITHTGATRKVTEIHERPYVGPVYAIKAEAHNTVYCTEEHPFWTYKNEQVKKNGRWLAEYIDNPDWIHAKCLDEGSTLVEPINSKVVTPDFVTRAFARLFGYYLAEGHVLRNKKKEIFGIEFSTHVDDTIHNEIDSLCEEFGTRNTPVTNPRKHSEYARSIQVFDERLALLCYEHGGAYSQHKKFSKEAMLWHPDLQREILGAYANGDGTGHSSGALGLSTSSTDLAWQWISILPRLGILASIQNLEHKAGSGFSRYNTYEWVIHIGKQWAQGLQDVTAKVVNNPVLLSRNTRHIYGESVATPIRHILVANEQTTVYNLEVEGDASYVVGGLAVHNCRVPYDRCSKCDNKASSRKEYCEHLKHHMNELEPSGLRICAMNDIGDFFDVSDVTVPADPSSGFLEKVASLETISSAQLAEMYALAEKYAKRKVIEEKESAIEKTGPDDKEKEVAPKIDAESESDLEEAGAALSKSDETLPENFLEKLSPFPLSDILGTAGMMGFKFNPQEYTFIVISKNNKPAARLAFREGKKLAEVPPADNPSFDVTRNFNNKIAELMIPWLKRRSMFPEFAARRLGSMSKTGSSCLDRTLDYPQASAVYSRYKLDLATMDTGKIACILQMHPIIAARLTGDFGKGIFYKESDKKSLEMDTYIARCILKGGM